MGNEIGGEYESFEQLFNDATIYMDAIKDSIKPNTRHYDLVIYNLEFHTWLTEKCSWNGKRDTYYSHFLTKDFFLRFMEYKTKQENELIAALEQEKQSWAIRKPEFATKQELTKKNNSEPTQFNDLFKDHSTYELCLKILKEIEVISDNNDCLLKERTGYKLFAAIHAMKYESRKYTFFKQSHTDNYLLYQFNSFLGTSYVKFKKDTKGFKNTVDAIKKIIEL